MHPSYSKICVDMSYFKKTSVYAQILEIKYHSIYALYIIYFLVSNLYLTEKQATILDLVSSLISCRYYKKQQAKSKYIVVTPVFTLTYFDAFFVYTT